MKLIFKNVAAATGAPRNVVDAVARMSFTSRLDQKSSIAWLSLCGGIDAIIDNLRMIKRAYRREARSIQEHGRNTWTRKQTFEACKVLYRRLGYSTEKDFPGEYYFMMNPGTLKKVRLYYGGKVWEYI
jgi:hypothetical protein